MIHLVRLWSVLAAALCLCLGTQGSAAPLPAAGTSEDPVLLSLPSGSRVELSVAYGGVGKLAYRWYRDGRLLRGIKAKKLPIASLSLAQRGAYVVEITDAADGVVARRMFFINVALPRGHLLALGDNSHGQTELPASLLPPTPIHAIAAGARHSLAVSDGVVRAWGDNEAGQCDTPALTGKSAYAVAAGADHSLALLGNGTVVAWGDNSAGQCDVPASLGLVRAIAAGTAHSLAVKLDGSVVGWGENGSGQLNAPAFPAAVAAIAAGHDHSLVLLENGLVVAWGANDRGQCDVPAGLKKIVSIGAAGDASFAVTQTGRVHVWGDTSFGQSPAPAKLKPVAAATGGWDFIAARLSNGGLAFWGDGAEALAAEGKGLGKIYSLAAGGGHVLALRNGSADAAPRILAQPATVSSTQWDEAVELSVTAKGAMLSYQWYRNGQPIAGATGSTYRVEAMRLSDVGSYTVRVFNGGRYVDSRAASINHPGMPPLEISLVTEVRQVRQIGERLRIELSASGAGLITYAWLKNGKVLPGETGAVLDLSVESEEQAGVYEAVARDEGSQSKALPSFVVVPPAQPTQLVAWGERGTGRTAIPDGLTDVIDVAAGRSHSLALRADGTVVAWGDNRFGQCIVPAGLDDVVAISAGEYYSAALRAGGTIVAWGGGKNPVTLATGNPRLTALYLLPAGVYAIERFEPSYRMGEGSTGSGVLTYQVLPNGNVSGSATNHLSPLLPLPKPATLAPASHGGKSVVSSGVVIITDGIGYYDYPPYPNERSAVYGSYGQQVRAFSHYHGRSATILADHSLRFWGTGSYTDEPYWGPRTSYWASYAINSDGRIENARSVLAGGTFFVWQRAGGGIGGLGEKEAFRGMPERLSGLKFWRAGESHVVAVLAGGSAQAPNIVSFSAGRAVAAGETVHLRVRAEGDHLRYQWLLNDEPIAGADDASWDVTAFAAGKAGAYRVRVSNGLASVLSPACELSLGTTPTLTQAPASRLGLRAGERLELAATVPDGSGYRFEWRRNGLLLANDTAASLVREAATLADAGRYTLRIIDGAGASTQTTSHVFVLPASGTRIIHEWDIQYPNAAPKPWVSLDDAVDFLPSGLALRLDGRVKAWGDHVREAQTIEWFDSLRDIVAISDWAMLRADGTLAISPKAYGIPDEVRTLNNIVALVSNPRSLVLSDGRVAVIDTKLKTTGFSSIMDYYVRWLGGVGELHEARAMNVRMVPELTISSGFVQTSLLVVTGADGSTLVDGPASAATSPELTGPNGALPDRDGGLSFVDATGTVRSASSFGRIRSPDASLADLLAAESTRDVRAELLADGSVKAWTLSTTDEGVTMTERTGFPTWRRDNLAVRIDNNGRVMTLRSADSLPKISFATARHVFTSDQPVVLEADVHGVGDLDLVWERNGAVLRGAKLARLELPANDPRNQGWYRVRVTDADGNSREVITYVLINHLGAKIEGLTSQAKAPALADVVEIGDQIAVLADGSVSMWDSFDGRTYGVVPSSLQDVVAVTVRGTALDASGRLTQWRPHSGEIIRQIEGVLWIRPGDRSSGFAIMRDGTVISLKDGDIHGTETWHREIVDVRDGQVGYNTLRALTRRDGSVAIHPVHVSFGATTRFLSPEQLGGTVIDCRVLFQKGAQFLVETSEGEHRMVDADGEMEITSVIALDRAPLSALGIDANENLISTTGTIMRSGILRLHSPWALVKPAADGP